ncbi:Putative tetratricopeptide-like helical domain superfamily [Septoria linicola]|uniref:Tetratricopeptide-like helical domain superfamily n=1 Tax=Septoria linicola TaxID=215465 RepID=A0A9Q9AQY6_9PEZI|nr:Putative tetratricopeptide-like helical domain superfamily [Septoria linicola]
MAIELLETTARAIQTQDSSTYCKICGEIVDIHVDTGQFEKAAGSLKSIINVTRQASEPDTAQLSALYMKLGNVYREMDMYKHAVDSL